MKVHIVQSDINPRHKGRQRDQIVPLSRKGLGDFVAKQLWACGYFVTAATIAKRRLKAELPNLGHKALTHRFTDPVSGRQFRGVWAWTAFSMKSNVSVTTLQTLVAGEHKRSPEFFTILRVFRALGLELVASPAANDDVSIIVRAW